MNIIERLTELERCMNEVQNPDRYSAIKNQNRGPVNYELEKLKEIIGVK